MGSLYVEIPGVFLHAETVYITSKLNHNREPGGSKGITQIFRGAESSTVLCKGGSEVTRGLSWFLVQHSEQLFLLGKDISPFTNSSKIYLPFKILSVSL